MPPPRPPGATIFYDLHTLSQTQTAAEKSVKYFVEITYDFI